MSKWMEALGEKPMRGPRTAARLERNDKLRDWAEKGYRVIDTGRGTDGGAAEPRPRRSDVYRGL